MTHESRIEGLTAAEADVIESEWRQLGATNIRRTPEPGGLFTMEATFPGSPFATATDAEVLQPIAATPPPAAPGISTSTSFAVIAGEYRALFDACVPDPAKEAQIQAQIKKIRLGEARYRALGERLGIPWFFIGIVHSLECSSNFALHLHNGDPLTARTVRVPKGRPVAGEPPFSWEQSAEDALRLKRLVDLSDWSLPAMLFRWESFNGMGYRTRGLPTPYLWSFSNLYKQGLFVADHVFDENARSKQCGAAVLLQRLQAP